MSTSPAVGLLALKPFRIAVCLAILAAASLGCGGKDPSFEQGQEIYKADCLACHGPGGRGVLYSKTVLDGSALVTGDPEEVTAAILFGRSGTGLMPGWDRKLTDQEVAAVTTYIRQAWSNQASPITAALVAKLRTREEKKSQ